MSTETCLIMRQHLFLHPEDMTLNVAAFEKLASIFRQLIAVPANNKNQSQLLEAQNNKCCKLSWLLYSLQNE